MPRLNGQGPEGQGAGTGRKMGSCGAQSKTGDFSYPGRQCRRGCCGRGLGFNGSESDLSSLEAKENFLSSELERVKKIKESLSAAE